MPLRVFVWDIDPETSLTFSDWFITAFFVVDIVFNFMTGYDEMGSIVMNSSAVVRRYASGAFWFDLYTTVPWRLLLAPLYDRHPYLFTLAVLNPALRILRVRYRRINVYVIQYAAQPAHRVAMFRIFLLLNFIAILAHVLACVWVKIGIRQSRC